MTKSALVTGATGQDGSFLMDLLLKKGYEVHGLVRRLSIPNIGNIQHLVDRVSLLDGDLIDQSSLNAAVKESEPDEVYNLAAQSFVGTSFVQPVLTGEITGLGAVRVLEAIRAYAPDARVYQASSSEMFGKVDREPQDESTPFHPRSPYGVAKVYAYWACVNYREAHSVSEFVEEAFRVAGISDWEAHVKVDEKNFRPSEIYNLRGDARKAKRVLGWQPKTKFKDLAKIMVEADIESLNESRTRK